MYISDDVAANDVAVGQLVSTLKAFRGGVTPIIPSVLTSYFAVGNQSKARNLVICDYDYDSALMITATSYDYETAKKLAVKLKDKHVLSANFPTFTEDSYKTPTTTKFTSANEIHRMCMLSQEDLHVEVQAFMDENCTNLIKNSNEYTKAFWQCVISIPKSGSTIMDDMANLMVNGHGCVVPVIIDVGGEAKKGHAWNAGNVEERIIYEISISPDHHLHPTPKSYQPDAEDILNIITANADNNRQRHERSTLGRMHKPSNSTTPFIHGDEVIRELYRKNMVLIPFIIDPY